MALPSAQMTTSLIEWVRNKADAWTSELDTLINIAQSQPQAVYSALTHEVISKRHYLTRTVLLLATFYNPLRIGFDINYFSSHWTGGTK